MIKHNEHLSNLQKKAVPSVFLLKKFFSGTILKSGDPVGGSRITFYSFDSRPTVNRKCCEAAKVLKRVWTGRFRRYRSGDEPDHRSP